MANPFQIVTFNVSTVTPPQPSKLQRMGAILSQRATTLAQGTFAYLSQASDLTQYLVAPLAISAISWSANVVSVTTSTPHGIPNSTTTVMQIAGVLPSGYNGSFTVTSTGTTTFTYPLLTNPGVETQLGTTTPADVAVLQGRVGTYFAQGSANGVFVLELQNFGVSDGVTNLTTFITANPNYFYRYLIPNSWSGSSTAAAYFTTFDNNTSKTYFDANAQVSTYSVYAGLKSVQCWVPVATDPVTEYDAAAAFYLMLNQNPSSSNPVTPLAFNFLYGVTPWNPVGNASTLAALKAAFVNVVAPASEGGLSNAMVYLGTQMDGKPFLYWYSVDWVQINGETNLANYIINQTQNKLNPLYYNQAGIDRLQGNLVQTMKQAISYGLALGNLTQTALPIAQFQQNFDNGDYAGQVVVNAEPFTVYTAENPNDYAAGTYNGLSVVYTPSQSFTQIMVNMVVTQFV